MSKGTFGVITAVLVWFGAATAAEAQGIDVTITGPSNIAEDTTSMTVTAGVNASSYMYWVKVKLNGVQKNYSGLRSATGSTISYPVGNLGSWGMAEDDTIEISVRVWTSASNYDLDVKTITVDPPSYYGFAPSKNDTRLRSPATPEASLAWLSREDLGVNA